MLITNLTTWLQTHMKDGTRSTTKTTRFIQPTFSLTVTALSRMKDTVKPTS